MGCGLRVGEKTGREESGGRAGAWREAHMLDEELVEQLVGVVGAQLVEAVTRCCVEAEEVEQPDRRGLRA